MWFLLIIIWIIMFAGVLMIPFGLPGTFIISGAALVYGLLTGFDGITLPFVLILFGIALLMEGLDYVILARMASRYGASRGGQWLAILGSILGAIIGTVTFPVVGSVIGAILGAFLGAFLAEYVKARDSATSFRAGWGAFLGRAGAVLVKTVAAIIMVVMIGFRL